MYAKKKAINNLKSLIGILLLLINTCTGENYIICGGNQFEASCIEGQVLVFDSANYGRTNSTICTPNARTNCKLPTTVSTLNQNCYGKQECSMRADADVFGDPCPGIPKYLEVAFHCIPEEEVTEMCHAKSDSNLIKLGDKAMGYIKSPNYPSKYNTNLYCVVTLRAREGFRYDVTILDLDVEARTHSAGCYDWLIIADDSTKTRTFDYCGTLADIHTYSPVKIEQLKEVSVTFRTNSLTERNGFLLKYIEVPAITKTKHQEL